MSVITLTSENFEKILSENEAVLCDFWAAWCGPCRMVSPVIDEIAEERSDVAVGKVNVDEQSEIASRFGIRSIPTVIVFKHGEEHTRVVGVREKEEYLELL